MGIVVLVVVAGVVWWMKTAGTNGEPKPAPTVPINLTPGMVPTGPPSVKSPTKGPIE